MKNFLFALVLMFSANLLAAQTNVSAAPIFENVDQTAAFPGGDAAFQDFVLKNQRPLDLQRSAVSSDVVVMKFVVETDGRLTTFRKVSAPNTMMEEETVVLLKKMRWTPAQKDGQLVRSVVELPVKLNLK